MNAQIRNIFTWLRIRLRSGLTTSEAKRNTFDVMPQVVNDRHMLKLTQWPALPLFYSSNTLVTRALLHMRNRYVPYAWFQQATQLSEFEHGQLMLLLDQSQCLSSLAPPDGNREYRLMRWPDLPQVYATAPVYRALATMSSRYVSADWFAEESMLTEDLSQALWAMLKEGDCLLGSGFSDSAVSPLWSSQYGGLIG